MTSKRLRRIVGIFLTIHVFLVVVMAWTHSPNPDEVAHLPCGLAIWKQGRFDLYAVNPPLVRLTASFPLLFTKARLPDSVKDLPRQEFEFGDRFLALNQQNARRYFFYARLACVPFTILGGIVCFLWASALFGKAPGVAALVLWCFSPNVIAWGSTICPDLAATSLGLLASYLFWRWLKQPTFSRALYCGLALGLCELSKLTWIVLYGLWPVVWLLWMFCSGKPLKQYWSTGKSLVGILLLALYVTNAFYLFEGTFSKLGSYRFQSDFFNDLQRQNVLGLNLGELRLPVPKDYVIGIDTQKRDFESGRLDSYLLGQWSTQQGWWYYYLVGMLVKAPTGTIVLFVLASLVFLFKRGDETTNDLDVLVLLLPALELFIFVSSQTGFSRHFRYVLPVVPFLFIFSSSLFVPSVARKARQLPYALLLWSTISSMLVFPHSFSYFNEIAGGPNNGWRFLLDSSLDWQQDLYFLKAWQDKNPEKSPLFVDYYGDNAPNLFGIKTAGKPPGFSRFRHNADAQDNAAPYPSGWYAVSVHELLHYTNDYQYLRDREPVDKIGFSIYIYHIEGDKKKSTAVREDAGPIVQ